MATRRWKEKRELAAVAHSGAVGVEKGVSPQRVDTKAYSWNSFPPEGRAWPSKIARWKPFKGGQPQHGQRSGASSLCSCQRRARRADGAELAEGKGAGQVRNNAMGSDDGNHVHTNFLFWRSIAKWSTFAEFLKLIMTERKSWPALACFRL